MCHCDTSQTQITNQVTSHFSSSGKEMRDKRTLALWSRITKKPRTSTGPLARLFVTLHRSLFCFLHLAPFARVLRCAKLFAHLLLRDIRLYFEPQWLGTRPPKYQTAVLCLLSIHYRTLLTKVSSFYFLSQHFPFLLFSFHASLLAPLPFLPGSPPCSPISPHYLSILSHHFLHYRPVHNACQFNRRPFIISLCFITILLQNEEGFSFFPLFS